MFILESIESKHYMLIYFLEANNLNTNMNQFILLNSLLILTAGKY
jgi:hypothetical protein